MRILNKFNWPAVAGVLFFLLGQWYGAYFMWYAHPGPLGMDDSIAYVYDVALCKVYALSDNPQLAGNKMLYPFLLAKISNVFGVSAASVFEWGFFIGLLLMGSVLWWLLSRIDGSPLFILIGLSLFGVYEGNNDAHGFFWVVPSFYAILLFLVSFGALFYSRHPLLYSMPVILLLVITHSIGAYLLVVLVCAYFFYEVVFAKNLKAFLFGVFFLIMGALLVAFFGNSMPYIFWLHSFGKSFDFYMTGWPDGSSASFKLLFDNFISGLRQLTNSINDYQLAYLHIWVWLLLLAKGAHSAFRNRKYPLLSIAIVLILGQLVMFVVSNHTYRFFYPLEIISYILISYGLYDAVRSLGFKRESAFPNISHLNAYSIFTILLSILFFYNALHWKVKHNYAFKFSPAWYFDQEGFQSYWRHLSDKRIAFMSDLDRRMIVAEMNDLSLLKEAMAASVGDVCDSGIKVVGQNPRYYGRDRKGVFVVLPAGSTLTMKIDLPAGKDYSLELFDSGISDVGKLLLGFDGTFKSSWEVQKQKVRRPEGPDMYPKFLLPWYRNPDLPWLGYRRGVHKSNVIRTISLYRMGFKTMSNVKELSLHNDGELLLLTGVIRIINDDGRIERVIDLDWGSAAELNRDLHCSIGGAVYPLLWKNASGSTLYRLDRNFKDVKVFESYAPHLEALVR